MIHKVSITITQADSPPEKRSFFLPLDREAALNQLKNLPLSDEELSYLAKNDEVLIEDMSGNSIHYELEEYIPPKEDR